MIGSLLARSVAASAAVACFAGLTGIAESATGTPVARIDTVRAAATVYVDTAACAGFAPAELRLSGLVSARYVEWFEAGSGINASEGWAKLDVSARVASHTYRVRQRYRFAPRQPRENVFGWSDTVITRDDGALMKGSSAVGLIAERGRDEISWLKTPICLPRGSQTTP